MRLNPYHLEGKFAAFGTVLGSNSRMQLISSKEILRSLGDIM